MALVASVICFNTQSTDLHVHAAAEHAVADHQHGPALHHHDSQVRLPLNALRITDLDADDTVISVWLCAASTSAAKPTPARRVYIGSVEQPTSTIVTGPRIVARAHGPPSSRPNSLRAPPASQPL